MASPLAEFDVFYISYDEPNAELNWSHLKNIAPWAQRVHRVKGFDAAHKRCAELSQTERFVTVDGDNQVRAEFFDQEISPVSDETYSWAGRNHVNGLVYGNGGLKCWHRDRVLSMKTHEAAERTEEAVDFCWDESYKQMNNVYSDVYINGSPFQAWRAGFREGVKMSLDRGSRVDPLRLSQVLPRRNLQRLLIWMSVGSDVKNGDWAILGARQGLMKANNRRVDWDFTDIADYDFFEKLWDREGYTDDFDADGMSKVFGRLIRSNYGLNLADLDQHASAWFKDVYPYPARLSAMHLEIA